jgi:hypothetical protein
MTLAGFCRPVPMTLAGFCRPVPMTLAGFCRPVPMTLAGFWSPVPMTLVGFWSPVPMTLVGFWSPVPMTLRAPTLDAFTIAPLALPFNTALSALSAEANDEKAKAGRALRNTAGNIFDITWLQDSFKRQAASVVNVNKVTNATAYVSSEPKYVMSTVGVKRLCNYRGEAEAFDS